LCEWQIGHVPALPLPGAVGMSALSSVLQFAPRRL